MGAFSTPLEWFILGAARNEGFTIIRWFYGKKIRFMMGVWNVDVDVGELWN